MDQRVDRIFASSGALSSGDLIAKMDIDLPDAAEIAPVVTQPAPEPVVEASREKSLGLVSGPLCSATSVFPSAPAPTPASVASAPHTRYKPQFASKRTILRHFRAHSASTKETAMAAQRGALHEMPTMPIAAAKDVRSDSPVSDEGRPSCTVCRRASRPAFNPLVPCRRCERSWHRLCHSPPIPEYVAAAAAAAAPVETPDDDTAASPWSCPACELAAVTQRTQRKRAMHLAQGRSEDHVLTLPPAAPLDATTILRLVRPVRRELGRRAAWTHRTVQQRFDYVARMAPREMAYCLLRAVQLHPDLPIFPSDGEQQREQEHERDRPAASPEAPASPFAHEHPTSTAATVSRAASRSTAAAAQSARPPAALPPPVRGPMTAAAVVAAARSNPQYRNGIISSIRRSHSEAMAIRSGMQSEDATKQPGLPRRPGRPRIHFTTGSAPARSRGPVPGSGRSYPPKISIERPPPGTTPLFEATPIDPVEEDPTGLLAAWPKPGKGLYAKLGPDWAVDDLPAKDDTTKLEDKSDDKSDDNPKDKSKDELEKKSKCQPVRPLTTATTALVDTRDYESFSSIVYDVDGHKVRENGWPVLVL